MRKLNLDLIKEQNTFEILDKEGNVLSTSSEKFLFDLNGADGLNDNEKAVSYCINLTEDVYYKGLDEPMTILTTCNPEWDVLMYLKNKEMSVSGALILYAKLCEDCMNELIHIAKNKENYVRTGITKCCYCKEVKNV